MKNDSTILVTGGTGLVGGAIARKLREDGFNVLTPSRKELSLTDYDMVTEYFATEKPNYVFHAASMVGGIGKNIKYPADFGFQNGLINLHIIEACKMFQVDKMLFIGSSCIYPRDCPQPMKEEFLLTGPCEPTNEMYALSKIYGIKLCQAYRKQYGCNFITCQPSNIYGVGDHFDPENAHVVGALINKFHSAKVNNEELITMWGTGSARRELLYVEDAADACVFLMKEYDGEELINVGTGIDISIKELANKIRETVGYNGDMTWDTTKPDGMPRKVVDVSKINTLGWKHKINLEEGLEKTYNWFLENVK